MIAKLVAALIVLPFLHDGSAMHGEIPRRDPVVLAIATACAPAADPARCAATLDVWAAYESGYGDATIGGGCPGVAIGTPCSRSAGARYCGPWMTECRRVPLGATLVDEARIAITMFRESAMTCPAHPFSIFAAGDCREHPVVVFRLAHVRRELAAIAKELAP